ncbi:ABC transporter ATP-binding protein [Plasticicumulans acidivorans]|uniref:Amino acid/amide ABC transporter ATP-binding protein 2 (HAAT family) n=1 Tax=Plasticicumulans acidivorans TaxID=886464 RepID=A0A317MU72_9GAMM|nr:ABC transporter ATP-binding protein [Plasticicumulans acidivorans]PWV60612.1 amino acid/amide ABC transporter ATP-binding protein 2 (HAAT family) [Plasticicumulans acidivorans]
MSEHLLEVRGIDAYYGPIQALREVSLHVDKGEIVTLIGANGAGKTTLLNTLFGNPRALVGHILFRGEEITRLPTYQIAKRGLALVPEGRHIFPGMTVEENLVMGTIPVGMEHADEDRQAMFELFPRLEERRDQRAGTLSGGEQQMLAIARALMARPEMILLDEPSLGLAPLVVKRIFEVLREIAGLGKTIFLVEQNANHALKLADRGYVLVNGVIELQGSGKELLGNPQVRQAYLGGH